MDEAIPSASGDPLELFQDWLRLAKQSEPNDPTAAALATADSAGRPSVRMVLIKRVDADGFRFFTNVNSQKGRELAENPWGSLCVHWKSMRRQIRVDGPVVRLSSAESDEYFHSRSRRSQIAAAVSLQSEELPERSVLEDAVDRFSVDHEGGDIPRPESWAGFALRPERIEFWSDGEDRLHHRLLFERASESWGCSLLYP